MLFHRLLIFKFSNQPFRKILSRMPSECQKAAWARHFVGPDLIPNHLQIYQQTRVGG